MLIGENYNALNPNTLIILKFSLFSYKQLIDPVIALLDSSKSEEEVPHEAFKGSILFSREKVS